MTHTYPIGQSALEALASGDVAVRTRYEAEASVPDGYHITALETEWITPAEAQLDGLMRQAEDNPATGFIQHYEDASGNTVLAITYWKRTASAQPAKIKPISPEVETNRADTHPDHTDDLYFREGRTRVRPRSKPVDPNQMDLFHIEPGSD